MRTQLHRSPGFTIVELIVTISIIGLLAGAAVIGFGAWRNSIAQTQVKSDLRAVAAAMENVKNFGGSYPNAIPDTVEVSEEVIVTPYSMGTAAYCIDGVSATNSNIKYYIASELKDAGPQEGDCATRSNVAMPDAVINLEVTAATSSSVSLEWEIATGASGYKAQCAQDPAFITGLKEQQTGSFGAITATVSGLTSDATVHCRVRALNSSGGGGWSNIVSTITVDGSCDTTGQYGTFPVCYDYDALPIASSIEGYWTTAPAGYLLEDGSAVSRTTYADLFAVIGTTYGAGNGSTTFNLPDSRGRTSVNISSTDTEFDTIGELYGSKSETLTIAQIPSHSHQAGWLPTGSDVSDYLGGSAAAYGMAASYAGRHGSYNMLEYVGGGEAHNNIQPSIVKTSAIKFRAPSGAQPQLPAGTTIQGYWTSAPTGYLLENGAAVSRSTYSALFSAIGTTHGAGNGSTTFNVPDSRGRLQVNRNSADTEFDGMGEKTGTKSETLTIAQIPNHTHQAPWQNGADVSDYLGGSYASYGLSATYAGRSGSYDMLEYVGGGQAHNNIQPSIVKTFAIKHTAASGSNDTMPKGTSIKGYWTSAPTGYLLEDGSAVSRSTYADLFAIIGTTYGSGNGSTTFNLPDSRGRTFVNRSLTDSEFDTMGEKTGSKTETLTIAQIPSHTHQVGWLSSGDPSDYLGGSGNNFGLTASYAARHGTYAMFEYVGGGQPHNEIQPSIVVTSAIKF